MLPVLNLGPLSLPVPQFVLLIGFWFGSVLSDRKSKALLDDPGFIDRLLWSSILAGILGARLSYFARNPAAFSGEYLSLFSLNLNFPPSRINTRSVVKLNAADIRLNCRK